MNLGKCELDPVAIVLTEIEVGRTMRFTGIDLESGANMVVAVDCSTHHGLPEPSRSFKADGFILMLTIEPIDL